MNRSIHPSCDPRSGSALLIVLGVMALLSVLVAGFGRGLRADLRASDGFYQEARNEQLALSALAAAKIELLKAGASMNRKSPSSRFTGRVFRWGGENWLIGF